MTTIKNTVSVDLSAIEELRGEVAPLYHKYPRQMNAQDAFIEMDEDGVVTASYNPEIGGAVRMDVWNRRTLRFGITPYLSGDELADIISQEKIINLLSAIYLGHEVRWDGSNHRGYLDPEAEAALDELADYLDRVEPSEETANAIMEEETTNRPSGSRINW